MLAGMRESKFMIRVMIMLIAFTFGALDLSLAQDVDLNDTGLPGGGGPSNNGSGNGDGGDAQGWSTQVGVIAYVDSIISIREAPTPLASGLVISGSNGMVMVNGVDFPVDTNLANSPVPEIEIVSKAQENTKLYKSGGKITVNGHFAVGAQLQDIQSKSIGLNLVKCETTEKAVAYVCLGNFANMNDNPEFWSKVSAGGSCEAIRNTGNLDLTGMIKAAFDASSTLSQIGILQVEYDDVGNVVKKTSIIVTRTDKVENWNGSHGITIEIKN